MAIKVVYYKKKLENLENLENVKSVKKKNLFLNVFEKGNKSSSLFD